MKFKKILFLFLVGVSLITVSFAGEIGFFGEVDKSVVGLDSSIQLSLIVTGAKAVGNVARFHMDGFDVKYLGPSQQVSINNGEYQNSTSFHYALYPQKVGEFKIPEIEIDVDGQKLKSYQILVSVVAAGAESGKMIDDLSKSVFIEQRLSSSEAYVNQKVILQVILYIADLKVRDIQYPKLEVQNVDWEEFSKPVETQQLINGVRYNIVVFERVFYPRRSGEIDFKPAELTCQLLVAKKEQTAQRRMGSLFDEDFLNDFLNLEEKRPLVLKSKENKLVVKDLPTEGRTADFSNGIGNFEFDFSVTPSQVKVGDPLTLRISVKGDGNLKGINFPKLSSSDSFKFYEPLIKQENDVKTFEQVVIPKDDQIKEFPGLEFSYFDLITKSYQTIRKAPISLEITPLAEGEQLKVVGFDPNLRSSAQEQLGEDIIFIKDNIGKLRPKGMRLYYQVTFYLMWLLIVGIWIGLYFYYILNERLKTDEKFAKSLRAPRQARVGLAKAETYLDRNQPKEFYDEIFKTLQNYLANKLGWSIGDVTAQRICERFSHDSKLVEVVNEVVIIFDECDAVRFALAQIDIRRMQVSYERLVQVIDYMERNWR